MQPLCPALLLGARSPQPGQREHQASRNKGSPFPPPRQAASFSARRCCAALAASGGEQGQSLPPGPQAAEGDRGTDGHTRCDDHPARCCELLS